MLRTGEGRWVYRWFSAGAADEDDVAVLQVFELRGAIIFEELAADGASPARRAGRRPVSSPVMLYEAPLCPPGSFSALNACSEVWAPASQNGWFQGLRSSQLLDAGALKRKKPDVLLEEGTKSRGGRGGKAPEEHGSSVAGCAGTFGAKGAASG